MKKIRPPFWEIAASAFLGIYQVKIHWNGFLLVYNLNLLREIRKEKSPKILYFFTEYSNTFYVNTSEIS